MEKEKYENPLIECLYFEDVIRTSGEEDVGVDGSEMHGWWGNN